MLRTYPHLRAYFTVELLDHRYHQCVNVSQSIRNLVAHVTGGPDVVMEMVHGDSAEMTAALGSVPEVTGLRTFFWLDAHTGDDDITVWPLPGEVHEIMRQWETGFVLIDDFLVPGKVQLYGHDAEHYNLQVPDLGRHLRYSHSQL